MQPLEPLAEIPRQADGQRTNARGPSTAHLSRLRRGKCFAQDDKAVVVQLHHYPQGILVDCKSVHAFAFLCISTVLQVLSAAWQRFSRGQSTHLGLRAMHRVRPCQMIW